MPSEYRGHQVVEIPNRSLHPHDEYIMWPADVQLAIGEWGYLVDADARNAVAIWHTHPSGNVGPSRSDMQKRIEGAAFLVVALDIDEETAIPTWF